MRGYLSPFTGPCPRLALHGMCHFDVLLFARLHDGRTVRKVLEDRGHKSAAVQLRRLRPGAKTLPASVTRALTELAGPELGPKVRAACNGDPEALAWINALGQWQWANQRRRMQGQDVPYVFEFMEAAEEESKTLVVRLAEVDYPRVAQALQGLPIHSQLLTPEAIAFIARGEHLLMIRLAMAFELGLAMIAAADASLHASPNFGELLPDGQQLPSQRLFKWLKRTVGVRTIPQLCKMQKPGMRLLDVELLKAWSSGKNQSPQLSRLERVIPRLLSAPHDAEAFWWRFAATRHLQMLGYCEQSLRDNLSKAGYGVDSPHFPFPRYMRGLRLFSEMAADRYPHWFAYHRGKLRTAGSLTRPSVRRTNVYFGLTGGTDPGRAVPPRSIML